MGVRSILSTAALAAAFGLSACTAYGDYGGYGYAGGPPPMAGEDDGRYGDYAYDGDDFGRGGHGDFEGPGAEALDPWLAETREGWYIVTRGFRDGAEGYVTDEVAVRANLWFRRFADADHDRRLTDEEIRRALAWAVTGPNIAEAR